MTQNPKRLQVCITIDTEFSIAGAFGDPKANKPVGSQAVYCDVDGVSNGLGVLLGAFDESDLRATFFVESLNRAYFGDAPMQDVVEKILSAGHDVQLHLHPVWQQVFSVPNWESQVQDIRPNDDITTRTQEHMVELINNGAENLRRWMGVSPVVLRTGNLCANHVLYKALAATDIRITSNIGAGIFLPEEARLHLYSGAHEIEQVCEFPVTSYRGIKRGAIRELKSMTIVGSSYEELVYVLNRAYHDELGTVVILTHPFEFIHGQSIQFQGARPNRLAQRRLRQLCSFLSSNQDRFAVVPMSSLKAASNVNANVLYDMPALRCVKRIIENKLNEYL